MEIEPMVIQALLLSIPMTIATLVNFTVQYVMKKYFTDSGSGSPSTAGAQDHRKDHHDSTTGSSNG